MSASGMIFDVKRFAIHDGPGVRTTLFLKGCPLHCRWCHNPESISPRPQLAYYAHKCINCGECVSGCPKQAHSFIGEKHYFDRKKCMACGACEELCLGKALRLYGGKITVDEALKLALEDRDFYGADGGVTLSGGEPLVQPEFCFKLLTELKKEGINTAVDTCGHVAWQAFERVISVTDLFLFDFKHPDSTEHKKLTGQDNEQIIANLQRLSEHNAIIEIRIPLIPGLNDSDVNLYATGEVLKKMNLKKVRLLPYHAMAVTKYAALGMANKMPKKEAPDDVALQRAAKILQSSNVNVVSEEG